jgi:hypothetical protein
MDWLAAGPWWEQDLGVSSRGLEEVAGRVVAGRAVAIEGLSRTSGTIA